MTTANTGGLAKGEIWTLIDEAMPTVKRLLLYGPPGTGKTHAAVMAAADAGEKVFQVTLTPDTPAAELIGHFVLRNGSTVWSDGAGVAAWRASHSGKARLVLNEVDHAGPDAVSAMHVLLDDLTTASCRLDNGETVKPGPGLRVVGTMNGTPDDLLPSLQDRFTVRLSVGEVAPGALAILPPRLKTVAMNTILVDDPVRRVSIRAWHEFHRLSGSLGDEKAAKLVFGNRWKELIDALKVAYEPEAAEKPVTAEKTVATKKK